MESLAENGGAKPKAPLERLPSSPKIFKQPTHNFPTKKLRMRSLLWVKPPAGNAVSSTTSFLAQVLKNNHCDAVKLEIDKKCSEGFQWYPETALENTF